MKEKYDNDTEFKMTTIFPNNIYMCFARSIVSILSHFFLRSFLYHKNKDSTNKWNPIFKNAFTLKKYRSTADFFCQF